jgi:hypothetical protein
MNPAATEGKVHRLVLIDLNINYHFTKEMTDYTQNKKTLMKPYTFGSWLTSRLSRGSPYSFASLTFVSFALVEFW